MNELLANFVSVALAVAAIIGFSVYAMRNPGLPGSEPFHFTDREDR